jgi:hypothetical protein
MSLKSLHAAFNARLAGYSFSGDKVYAGKVSQPQPGRPRIEGRMAGITRTPTGPGAGSAFEWQGRYQVSVFYPVNFGMDPILEEVDRLIARFPRGLSLTGTDGQVATILSAAPSPEVEMPNFVLIPLIVQWQSYEV